MMPELHILISRLKQQPRHGMAKKNQNEITPNDYFDAQKKFITEWSKFQLEFSRDSETVRSSLNDLFNVMKTGFTEVVGSVMDSSVILQTGLNQVSHVFDATTSSALKLIKSATYLEQRNAALNKTFRMNVINAANLGEQYDLMAEKIGLGGEALRRTGARIEALIPGMGGLIAKNKMWDARRQENIDVSNKFNQGLILTNTLLEDNLGVTGEAAQNYELYAAGMDKSSMGMLGATNELANRLEKTTGMTGMFSSILQDVANLGADIQMQYKKMPGQLELAVVKAKVLGVTFKQLDATAKGFLNVEESVNNELEYQLISGKRLIDQNGQSIAQKFQEAKLAGNPLKMAEAMNDVYESQQDILEGNNFYAKEQLAKTLGMTEEALMKSYQMQKLYKKTGMDTASVDKLLAMSPEDFEKAAENMSADQLDTFKKIQEEKSQKSQ
jgi:hypothetical protein